MTGVFLKFGDLTEAINDEILRHFEEGEPALLYDATRHLLTAGGKRVRPLLCILSAGALGKEYKDILPSAASIEIIHTFTLIHDDIMDADPLRRGVPAVHEVYGDSRAILAGDLLFSKVSISMRAKRKITCSICTNNVLDS